MNIAVGLMLPETLYTLIKEETDQRGQLTVAETCRSIIGEWGYKKREEKYGKENLKEVQD